MVRTFTALNADTVATDLDKSLLRWTSAQKCRLRMATGMTQQISREIWASASARTPFLAEKWPRSPRRSLRSCSGACVLAMDLWFELHYQQILSPYSMAASVQHPVCQTPHNSAPDFAEGPRPASNSRSNATAQQKLQELNDTSISSKGSKSYASFKRFRTNVPTTSLVADVVLSALTLTPDTHSDTIRSHLPKDIPSQLVFPHCWTCLRILEQSDVH